MESHFFVSKYGDELVAEIIQYFKELDGKDTSLEEAEEYLDSLADLYRCLERSAAGVAREREESARRKAADSSPSYPCSLNT